MKRWLVLPPLFLIGLFVALHATAAVHDADAKVVLETVSAGHYRLNVENTGSEIINSVAFGAGPAFKVSSVDSSSVGSCQLANATSFSCSVALDPPPCACMPGGNVNVFFTAAGDPAGSSVKLNNVKTIAVGGGSTQTTTQTTTQPTTTQPTTTQTTPKPKAKPKFVKCKKGQKSTKAKPCKK
jgi:hypothetical protein